MHLTLGILSVFQAFFYALSFFWLDGFAVPAPAQVTHAVGQLAFPTIIMPPVSKEAAENAIFERFLIAYQKRFDVKLTGIVHRDRPDFAATNPVTSERIGIEITGTYQNDLEAKIQYSAVEDWESFQGSSDEILASLNSRLRDKAEKSKSYNFDGQIILAIWLGSLVFNQKFDVDFIRNGLVIPQNEFSEIWLIIRDKNDYSPELYPLQT